MKVSPNLRSVFTSKEAKEYIKCCKEIKDFLEKGYVEPAALSRKYKSALENYRKFLDELGLVLPNPKCPMNRNQVKTQRYLDVVLKDNGYYIRMIENPRWIYRGA